MKKEKIIFWSWIGYVLLLFFFYKKMVAWVINGNTFSSIILYLIGNPAYLLLIFAITKMTQTYGASAIRRILGSVCFVLALDIVAVPRYLIDETLRQGAISIVNLDSIIIGAFDKIFPHQISFYLFYIVVPIALVYFAIRLLGYSNLIKTKV